MDKDQTDTAREDIFVPLFLLQMPQKTLARKNLTISDWEQAISLTTNTSVNESSMLDTFITLEEFRQLILLGVKYFSESDFIKSWSSDVQPIHAGPIGQAFLSANNVAESIKVLLTYGSVILPHIGVDAKTVGKDLVITFTNAHSFPEVADVVMEIFALTVAKGFRFLNIPEEDINIGFRHKQIHEKGLYENLHDIVPSFSQAKNFVRIPEDYLTLANDNASPIINLQAIKDCELLKSKIKGLITVTQRTEHVLFEGSQIGKHYSLDEISDKLNMSHRTISRKLKEENTSFRELQSLVRVKLAKQQLRTSRKPIKSICADAGFQSISAFSRAFRKRTGMSPTEYRDQSSHS